MYKKMKKVVAVILATTMVMGSSVMASAETSGSSVHTGSNEGSIVMPALNFVFPTVATNTYNYIMDPEGLIRDTDHMRYQNATFSPTESDDTYVYFTKTTSNGAVTYANDSAEKTVTNKSMVPIKVTLQATAEATSGAISLVKTKAEAARSVSSPALYLGLVVSGESVGLEAGKAVEKVITIDGVETNYVKTYTDSAYTYVVSDGATNWNSVGFKMEGAVSKCSGKASDGKTWTAPGITFTWKVEDPTAVPAIPEKTSAASALTIPDSGKVSLKITAGADEATVTSITTDWFDGNMLSITNGWGATYNASSNKIEFDTGISDGIREGAGDGKKITVTFTPATGEAYTQTINIS